MDTTTINAQRGLMFLGTQQYCDIAKQLVAWSLIMGKPNMNDGPAQLMFNMSSLLKDFKEISQELGDEDLTVIQEGLIRDTDLDNVSADNYLLSNRDWVRETIRTYLVVKETKEEVSEEQESFSAKDGSDDPDYSDEFRELSKGMGKEADSKEE